MVNSKFHNSPLLKEVIAIIRAQTARIGVKNETLAINAGLSRSQLSKIFHEQQMPTLDQLDNLCQQLHLELHEVIREASQHCEKKYDPTTSQISRSSLAHNINCEGI